MKKEWYLTLKATGFEDIENGLRIVDHKTTDDLAYRKDFQTKEQFDAKLKYFVWASRMLEHGSFRSEKDRLIWDYHSDGHSRRRISKEIGIDDRWCSRKILQIRDYLMMSSQSAVYG